MSDLAYEALIDSAKTVPFLLFIYFIVEWFERRFGHTIESRLQGKAAFGPLLGAICGCIPQCGFSVVASALYARRLITKGTLLAVFLATSDEAIPVILAQHQQGKTVIKLLITKLIIGLVGGYAIDIVLGSYRRQRAIGGQPAVAEVHEHGCCHHDPGGTTAKWQWLVHPLVHTAKTFLFIVLVTLGINYLMGEDSFKILFFRHSIFQPFLAALVGLIPNCAASVAIAELFLKGGLSYGSTIAGLCSSSGIGLLVLMKENRDKRDTLKVLLLLVAISTAVGIAIQLLYG
jgi:hypothetical protein